MEKWGEDVIVNYGIKINYYIIKKQFHDFIY